MLFFCEHFVNSVSCCYATILTGSIEKGKAADMIVTDQNPLEDLRALRNLNMVIAGDRIIEYPLDYFIGFLQ